VCSSRFIYIYIYIPLETSFLAHPMVLSTVGLRHHVPGAELVELLGPLGPLGTLGPLDILLSLSALATPSDHTLVLRVS